MHQTVAFRKIKFQNFPPLLHTTHLTSAVLKRTPLLKILDPPLKIMSSAVSVYTSSLLLGFTVINWTVAARSLLIRAMMKSNRTEFCFSLENGGKRSGCDAGALCWQSALVRHVESWQFSVRPRGPRENGAGQLDDSLSGVSTVL